MARDVSETSVTDLPEGVGDLITEIARERGVSEEELLERLLGEREAVAEQFDTVRTDLDELEARINTLDDAFAEKLSDVRDRVVQVKRETDEKADANHDHPDLVTDIGDVAADVDALAADVEELEHRVETAVQEASAETEAVREAVDAVSEDATRKLNVLGAAVLEMRDQVRTLLAEREKRALTEELQRQANRNGIRSATCESCSNAVQIGLLSKPRCPHCNESFDALDPKDGFFGSNVLTTGSPPELDGEIGGATSGLDDIVEE